MLGGEGGVSEEEGGVLVMTKKLDLNVGVNQAKKKAEKNHFRRGSDQ